MEKSNIVNIPTIKEIYTMNIIIITISIFGDKHVIWFFFRELFEHLEILLNIEEI